MNLDRNDVLKFNILYQHFDPISPNVGIIGDITYIKKKINTLKKTIPHDLLIENNEKLCYIFMLDDRELTFYGIQNLTDIDNLYFKKYI